ncbi:MAG: hypothetical protein AB7F25_12290 [Deferribacterales bacterium]
MRCTEDLFRLIAPTETEYYWLMNWLAVRYQTDELSDVVVKITGDDGGALSAILEMLLGEVFGRGINVLRLHEQQITYIAHKRRQNVIIVEQWYDEQINGIRKPIQVFNVLRCPAFTLAFIECLHDELTAFKEFLQSYETDMTIYSTRGVA